MSNNIVNLRGNSEAIEDLENVVKQLRSGKCPGCVLVWSPSGEGNDMHYAIHKGFEKGLTVSQTVGCLNICSQHIIYHHLDSVGEL